MPTPRVSLSEVLQALGGPLEERTLWALLRQATNALREEMKAVEAGASLLITPESLLLLSGGAVQLLRGISDYSSFTAPEFFPNEASIAGSKAVEKAYVYSLGMTVFTAMDNGLEEGKSAQVGNQLQGLLVRMVEDSAEQRASLEEAMSLCQTYCPEGAEEEVDKLVTYILGSTTMDLSDEYEMDDADLETELHSAMNMRSSGSVEQLHAPSYGSRTGSSLSLASKGSQSHGSSGNLQRNSSFRSSGGDSRENVAFTPFSALPPAYYSTGGSQDRLHMLQKRGALSAGRYPRDYRWSSHERLMLHIQPQDLDILAAKGTGRQLPPNPVYGSHLYTPTRARKATQVQKQPKHADIRRSASFNVEYSPPASSSVPQSAGLPTVGFFRTSSGGPMPGNVKPSSPTEAADHPHHPPLRLSDTLPPLPDTPPPLEPVEAVQEPTFAQESVPPLESDAPPDTLQGERERVEHREDDNVEELATPHMLSEDDGSHLPQQRAELPEVASTSITLDDMPSLPPPPPKLAREQEETLPPPLLEEEGRTAEVIPTIEKIDSLLLRKQLPTPEDKEKTSSDKTEPLPRAEESEATVVHTTHPPPLPSTEPPMFTPMKRTEEEEVNPPNASPLNSTFDYSGMNTALQAVATARKPEDEFEFPVNPESPAETETNHLVPPDGLPPSEYEDEDVPPPSPPPLPLSTPPFFESQESFQIPEPAVRGFTPPSSPPPLPACSPPQLAVAESVAVAETYVQESLPPLGEQRHEGEGAPSSGTEENEERRKALEHALTPRRALEEAFKAVLDNASDQSSDDDYDPGYSVVKRTGLEAASPDHDSDDDYDPAYSVVKRIDFEPALPQQEKGDSGLGEQTAKLYAQVSKPPSHHETWPRERHGETSDNRQRPLSELYAQVSKPPSHHETWPRERHGETSDNRQRPLSELYAKVDKSRKRKRSEDAEEPPTSQDLSRKFSSEGDVAVQYAEVHDPKRSSMPPDSLADPHYSELTTPPPSTPPPPVPSQQGGSEDWPKVQSETSMAKLQKVLGPDFVQLSGGKPKETKVVSTRPGVYIPEGRRRVKVVLLNGRSVNFMVEHDSCCRELFEQVISYHSLREHHVFGLAVVKDREEFFLEFDRKLSKYAPPGWVSTPLPSHPSPRSHPLPPLFRVFFRVRYYVENVSELRHAHTRHQYYLQLRKDILEGMMFCPEETALSLASFALQAEKGDFDPQGDRHGYFRPEQYISEKVIAKLQRQYIHDLLPDMHAERYGLSREAAELDFLKEAQKLQEYGMIFHRVAKEKYGTIGRVCLGFSVRGVVVYDVHRDVKTPTQYCPWRKTRNISFANRKFILELQGSKPVTFYTDSYKKARYLLHLSISYHRFQLVMRGVLPADSLSVGVSPHAPSDTLSMSPSPPLSPDHKLPNSPTKGSAVISGEEREGMCEVKLLKEPMKGLGITIVDQLGSEGRREVAVGELVKGGPAHVDGRLKKGDVLLSVEGQSVEGLGHKEVADLLRNAPSVVTLSVRSEPKVDRPPQSPPPLNQLVQEEVAMVTEVVLEEQPPPSHRHAKTLTKMTTLERDSTPTLPQHTLPPTPMEDLTIQIRRGEKGSFGFAIAGSPEEGHVCVLRVTPGGAAQGSLQDGDRIISVNEVPVEGRSYLDVLSMMQESGEEQQLTVKRRASPSSTLHVDNLPEGERFLVEVKKLQGALGLRIAGGKDRPYGQGFIRIKEMFRGSAAENTGKLRVNDILLEVNGESLANVTHRQAAEVLQNSGERVCLLVYHPTDPSWLNTSLETPEREHSPPPPADGDSLLHSPEGGHVELDLSIETHRQPPDVTLPNLKEEEEPQDDVWASPLSSWSVPSLLTPTETTEESKRLSEAYSEPYLLDVGVESAPHTGEEEEEEIISVQLKKGLRGFGFKINRSLSGQEDHGVFVLSVEENPAKAEGTLRPGDEIIEVNGATVLNLSHAEGVKVLRSVVGMGNLVIRRQRERAKPTAEMLLSPQDTLPTVTAPECEREIPRLELQDTQPMRPKFHFPPPPLDSPPPLPPSEPPPELAEEPAELVTEEVLLAAGPEELHTPPPLPELLHEPTHPTDQLHTAEELPSEDNEVPPPPIGPPPPPTDQPRDLPSEDNEVPPPPIGPPPPPTDQPRDLPSEDNEVPPPPIGPPPPPTDQPRDLPSEDNEVPPPPTELPPQAEIEDTGFEGLPEAPPPPTGPPPETEIATSAETLDTGLPSLPAVPPPESEGDGISVAVLAEVHLPSEDFPRPPSEDELASLTPSEGSHDDDLPSVTSESLESGGEEPPPIPASPPPPLGATDRQKELTKSKENLSTQHV